MQSHSPYFLLRIILALSVAFSIFQIVYSAWQADMTLDEPFHLAWNNRLLDQGITERQSVYNYVSTTPALQPNLIIERAIRAAFNIPKQQSLFLTRLFNLVWFLGMLVGVFVIAKMAAGSVAAYIATIGSSLDPNFIAHSSLATVDMALTCVTVALLATFVSLVRDARVITTVIFGVTVGFALWIKLHALIVLVTFAFFPLAWSRIPALNWKRLFTCVAGFLVVASLSCLVLSAGYMFLEVGTPLSEIEFFNKLFRGAAISFPDLRLPVPAAYLTGVDQSLEAAKRAEWNVVHMGQWFPHGVWYYFISLWLLKTPSLIIGAQLAGFYKGIMTRMFFTKPILRFLAAVVLFYFVYFSFFFSTQVGYRYILPCLPFLYVLAAAGLSKLRRTRLALGMGMAVVIVSIAELSWYSGNPLSFTHTLVQPKHHVYRLMADSNIDWGQNRWSVSEILRENNVQRSHIDPLHILPGHNTISLNKLAGVFWNFEQHSWVREHLKPNGHYRHTYLWYQVDPATFRRFLEQERSINSAQNSAGNCGHTNPLAETKGSQVLTVSGEESLCILADTKSVIQIKNEQGEFRIGPRGPRSNCDLEKLTGGQESWWILEPGVYEFCMVAVTSARVRLHANEGDVRIRR